MDATDDSPPVETDWHNWVDENRFEFLMLMHPDGCWRTAPKY